MRPIGDVSYAVIRLKDMSQPEHGGNIEYLPKQMHVLRADAEAELVVALNETLDNGEVG